MPKLTLADIGNLQNETTAVATYNSNNALMEEALDNTISRDGSIPNQMNSEFDMNGHRIINASDAVNNQDVVTLNQLNDTVSGIVAGTVASASFVTLAPNTVLTDERILTAGTNISLVDGGSGGAVTVAISDDELNALATTVSAADRVPYYTGVGTANTTPLTSFGRSLIDDASAGAALTTLGAQPLDADLTAVAALATTGIARRTGANTWTASNAVTNSELNTMGAFSFKGNNTASTATPTDVDIATLTTKASPASGDYVMISDQAASGAWKKATVTSIGTSSGVSTIAGNTGAFTLGTGINNSANVIKLSLANASVNVNGFGGPPNTTSLSQVMLGLGSAANITPTYSGRILLNFHGHVVNLTASGSTIFQTRYGTGVAPAPGAASTGTIVDQEITYIASNAGYTVPFFSGGIVVSLTPGVNYWFDIGYRVSTGTGGFNGITFSAMEF